MADIPNPALAAVVSNSSGSGHEAQGHQPFEWLLHLRQHMKVLLIKPTRTFFRGIEHSKQKSHTEHRAAQRALSLIILPMNCGYMIVIYAAV